MHQREFDTSSYLVFSGLVPEGRHTFQIYVARLDGSDLHRMSYRQEVHEGHPTWSPEGLSVVFESSGDIYRVALDGSSVICLTEGTVGSAVQWMPDGHHILYFGEGGAGHWHVVDVAGRERRRIFGDHAFNQVSVAPDGAHFAVTTLDNDYGFRVVTDEGQTLEELAASYRYVGAPTWSPDGDCIAFSAAADEEATVSGLYVLLYVLTRATGEVRRVSGMALEGTFVWSPDGERLAVVDHAPLGHGDALYVINRDGSVRQHVLDLNAGDLSGELRPASPAWSPDGQHVAVSTLVDQGFVIDIYTVDGSLERRLRWSSPSFRLIYDVAWQPRARAAAVQRQHELP